MRKIAVVAALLALAGCWYDRPNPWNTTSDRRDYLDKKERDWLLEMKEPYELPQHEGAQFTLPDLDSWRDTVLANSDGPTLSRMRDQSVQKAATLEARAMAMAPMNESNKVQIYELLWQTRVEKVRLRMIEERISVVGN
jgi:hypothetical protein